MTVHDHRQPLRVAFHTLGCRLNQYDTESLKVALQAHQPVQIVGWADEADVYLLNSCTVTGKADQECRRLARQVKRKRPQARVVVAGCYAQTQPQNLAAVQEIDGIVGNTAKDDIARWLPALLAGESVVAVEEFDRTARFDSSVIEGFSGRSRAYVKVQDGCDLRCAYCLIWQARGPSRSRSLADVLAQIERLHIARGYHELILTGVHLGRWGADLEDRRRLPDLIATVCDAFPELRIRLSSIHPNEVTRELLALLTDRPQLRPHLHISLQSGSDTVLARMRRPYGRERALAAVTAAAGVGREFGLGADVIVGFPGETEAEFAETMDMVDTLPFTYLHVFRYSPRPGTAAAEMVKVHPETVYARAAELRRLAEKKHRAFLVSLVGQTREAVVEDRDPRKATRSSATTENYAPVTVETDVPAGTLVDVHLDDYNEGRLMGSVVNIIREAARE